MHFFRLLTFGFLVLIVPYATSAEESNAFSMPMQFISFTPCPGNASYCGESILAIGLIEADSATKLEAKNPSPGTHLYFHSPGGSLIGGLKLGAAIRKLKLHTIAGGAYTEEYSSGDFHTLVENSICASSAAFAFLGGVRREVVNPESYLLHQFYTELRNTPESHVQETVALLNSYLDEMQIKRELLDAALLTKPEKLSFYSVQDLWRLGVYNSEISSPLPKELKSEVPWSLKFSSNDRAFLYKKWELNQKTGEVALLLTKANQSFVFTLLVQWKSTILGT